MNTAPLQEAEQYARELFREKPNLGIDDAARQINDRCKRGLIKPTIAVIRREVRQRLEAEALFDKTAQQKLGPHPGFVIRRKQIFNPVRVTINPEPLRDVRSSLEALAAQNEMEVRPQETTVPTAKPIEKPKPASAELKNSKLERLKFLETWCLEHVQTATIESARDALREQFNGVAMGTKIISDTLRMAKQIYEEQTQNALRLVEQTVALPPAVEVSAPKSVMSHVPVQHQVAQLASQMRALGVRLVEITPDGHVRVEFSPS